MSNKEHFFKPRARLLLQLGNQLIKDEGLALFELVKNSYDADATYSDVQLNYIDKKNIGEITIKDNGSGMNYSLIVNHWLEPGTDIKEKLIGNTERSKLYKRLPLGEKGIGRFGSHKLGQVIQLITKTDFDHEVEINIDWKAFEDVKYLHEAPIDIIEREKSTFFKQSISAIPLNKFIELIDRIDDQNDILVLNDFYTEGIDSYILNQSILNDIEKYKNLKIVLNKYEYITSGTYIKITNLWENWSRGMLRSAYRAVNAINSPFENNKASDFKVTVSTDKDDWLDKLLTTKDAIKQALFHVNGYIENSEIHLTYNFFPFDKMKKVIKRHVVKTDCDFVQGKRKKLRLIFGLLIPYNFQNILAEETKLRAIHIIGDNIITTPIINYDQKTYQVIFDLHTVTGINEEAFSRMKPIFRFRKELLVDVQQKVASHIARPGFFNMNDYLK